MKLALRIVVDTYRGTLLGVPRLLEILQRHGVQATFLFSLGPDHTGRAVGQMLRAGNARAAWHTQAKSRYGVKSLFYGTLLPAPDIGRRCADGMRAVADAGHEVAIHAWDRVRWLRNAEQADAAWTEREMRRAQTRFAEIFGRESPGHGAAGWQMNAHALRLTQRLGFAWASDCRGTHPFMPVWRGEPIHCPQLPTTLPTLGELIAAGEYVPDDLHRPLLKATVDVPAGGHVHTVHAELEGIGFAAVFERLLEGWRDQGYALVGLGELFASLDADTLPRHDIVRGTLPGRSAPLMLQGEAFLSSWKEVA